MPKTSPRVVELDILRAVAIILILTPHFPYFLPTVQFSRELTILKSCGIALFIFISGYVLHLNHPSFPQRNSLADFYKKRVLRIFPLYWLALALTIVIGATLTPQIAFITFLGLQGFLSPRFSSDLANGWWFIGTIVV